MPRPRLASRPTPSLLLFACVTQMQHVISVLLLDPGNLKLALINSVCFWMACLLSESAVPGSVPALSGLGIRPYTGNVMIPFEGDFAMFG